MTIKSEITIFIEREVEKTMAKLILKNYNSYLPEAFKDHIVMWDKNGHPIKHNDIFEMSCSLNWNSTGILTYLIQYRPEYHAFMLYDMDTPAWEDDKVAHHLWRPLKPDWFEKSHSDDIVFKCKYEPKKEK